MRINLSAEVKNIKNIVNAEIVKNIPLIISVNDLELYLDEITFNYSIDSSLCNVMTLNRFINDCEHHSLNGKMLAYNDFERAVNALIIEEIADILHANFLKFVESKSHDNDSLVSFASIKKEIFKLPISQSDI